MRVNTIFKSQTTYYYVRGIAMHSIGHARILTLALTMILLSSAAVAMLPSGDEQAQSSDDLALGAWVGYTKELSTSQNHSLVIKTDGTLWAWGDNGYGELGLGDTSPRDVPTQVGVGTDWIAVSSGDFHTIAIKTDGTLWSWGVNDYGELGLGDSGFSANRLVPTQIGTDDDWSIISAGRYHNLATKTDGTLWAWGWNNYGKLGLGDTVDRLIPTQVGMDTDWTLISVGRHQNLATKTDGTLWAWGYNLDGQLGLGDTTNRDVPTQVGMDTDWALISTRFHHSLAIKTDGTLWSWGNNDQGQLGLGDTTNRDVPTQVGTDTDWALISTGWNHSTALKTDGTLWSWGQNYYGQLGFGDTTDRDVPTHVLFFSTEETIIITPPSAEIEVGEYVEFILEIDGPADLVISDPDILNPNGLEWDSYEMKICGTPICSGKTKVSWDLVSESASYVSTFDMTIITLGAGEEEEPADAGDDAAEINLVYVAVAVVAVIAGLVALGLGHKIIGIAVAAVSALFLAILLIFPGLIG